MIPSESDPVWRVLSQATQESPDQEHDDRAEGRDAQRAQVEITGGNVTPPEGASYQPADEGAENAEDDRDDATRRVAAWYQEFCE